MDSGQRGSLRPLASSPFDRIIALDWYDGLKAGLAMCTASKRAYSIEFRSWDDEEIRRVYSLSPIEAADFEHVLALIRCLGAPRWPIWFPKWQFQAREAQEAAERALARLSEKLQPAFLVLAQDLSKEIIRSAALTDSRLRERCALMEATNARFEAWEAFLEENGRPGATALCE